MSEIVKTKGIILKRIDFSDSSRIASLYTEKLGKLSCIIKGARSPKSKSGKIADILNLLTVVIYNKEGREVQIISEIDLINHFPKIKADLEASSYAFSISEIIDQLIPEHEPNHKIFLATEKILNLINENVDQAQFFFTKYLLFIIKEIGYEFEFESCSQCSKNLGESDKVGFNYELGFLCGDCSKDHLINFEFEKELFNFIICLSKRIEIKNYKSADLDKIIFFLEKYLSYHVDQFKGLKSIKFFKS